jgi:hypothetical protein
MLHSNADPTTRVPNEIIERPLVRKMFVKISYNRLNNRRNIAKMLCCAEHQKRDAFQRFCLTFRKLFFSLILSAQVRQVSAFGRKQAMASWLLWK